MNREPSNTCPSIDKYIREVEYSIENTITDLNRLKDEISSFFEDCRSSNSILREWAYDHVKENDADNESIINDLRGRINDLECQVEQLEASKSDSQ